MIENEFTTISSSAPFPSRSVASYGGHQFQHSKGKSIHESATPSPVWSTARMCLSGDAYRGHVPSSLTETPVHAFPSAPSPRKLIPPSRSAKQTGNPMPMSSASLGNGLSAGDGEGSTTPPSGSGCQEGFDPSMFGTTRGPVPSLPTTKIPSLPPSNAIDAPFGDQTGFAGASSPVNTVT